jgi:hypothetical protein
MYARRSPDDQDDARAQSDKGTSKVSEETKRRRDARERVQSKCKDSNCKTVEAFPVGKMLIVFCAGSLEWLESTCMHGLDEQAMVLQNYACGWLAQKQMLQDCSTSCAKTRIAGYSRLI